MKEKDMRDTVYTEVWGDRVDLKELAISSLIGIVITMGSFLLGQKIFHNIESIEASLADGYALIFGVCGTLLSGFISARLFKPKRVVEDQVEFEEIEEILKSAGISLEQEVKALADADQDLIEEMEDLELYSLLALIPEGSKNYKPEYKEMAGGN